MNTKPGNNKKTDIVTAIEEMIAIIDDLADIYSEEIMILDAADGNGFLEHQEKKAIAARAYQTVMVNMIDRKDEIKAAPEEIRRKLKETHARFSDLTSRNLEALERMQRCTERLGDTIRNAAIREARNKQSYSYGQNGKMSDSLQGRRISSGISETA